VHLADLLPLHPVDVDHPQHLKVSICLLYLRRKQVLLPLQLRRHSSVQRSLFLPAVHTSLCLLDLSSSVIRSYSDPVSQSLLTIFRTRQSGGDQSRDRDASIERCDVAVDDGIGKQSRLVARISFRNGALFPYGECARASFSVLTAFQGSRHHTRFRTKSRPQPTPNSTRMKLGTTGLFRPGRYGSSWTTSGPA
jgi:hypothetical protein